MTQNEPEKDRNARLAAALRANLGRRKQQARSRHAAQESAGPAEEPSWPREKPPEGPKE